MTPLDAEHEFFPIELRSTVLQSAIWQVDNHIVRLERLVEEQGAEIKILKEVADKASHQLRVNLEAKVFRQLGMVLDHGEGVPPITQDLGLDAVLILKHVQEALWEIRGIHDEGIDAYHQIEGLQEYIDIALEKAKGLVIEGEL